MSVAKNDDSIRYDTEDEMSKEHMYVVYQGESIAVSMGRHMWRTHLFDRGFPMNYYVVRETGKPSVRFMGETALEDVCRYAIQVEFKSVLHIKEFTTLLNSIA